MEFTEIAAVIRANVDGALIALDFDGTLAPIVPDPADSRPVDGIVAALTELAQRGAQIAVITGRDAQTVLGLSGLDVVPRIIIEGLYGAETWHRGELTTPPTPAVIKTLRLRLPGALADADPDVWVEDKRLSLVVHGRLAADPEAVLAPLQAPVAALAEELGLDVHAGRGVIELRLPGFDKGGALCRLVERSRPTAVLFAGDDVGDLPAFAEIAALRDAGTQAWGIGVRSVEVPELNAAADVYADGPTALAALLIDLAAD
ncbi:MAG: trehalose-phosphatase [Jatrophihabitantaceae bacterium]